MNYRELKQYLSTLSNEQLEHDVVLIDLDSETAQTIDGITTSSSKHEKELCKVMNTDVTSPYMWIY